MTRLYETTRYIEAPPQSVWEVLFDVARWPDWMPTVDSVQRLDDGPLQVGSRAKVRQPKLPPMVWEVTQLVAGRSFTWQASTPGARTVGRHEVVPDRTGCNVTLSIEHAGPAVAVVAMVWGRLTQRYIETEAECLAKRVSREQAT